MAHFIVGIMGPGEGAGDSDINTAYKLGQAIAKNGWITLTGGRDTGVMAAALRGAKENGGSTIGILPGNDLTGASEHIDIPIVTGMGQGRNVINILSSHIVISCGSGAGTSSEISHAIKAGKHVILMNQSIEGIQYFRSLDQELVRVADDPQEAVQIVLNFIKEG